jgi:3',5'-cyclic-AMP phosphodiesterase
MLLAQLSDPHVDDGDPGAAAALARAVQALLDLRPAPDAVLVSGDLAEHASPTEYERVRELLAPLPMPVAAIPGNHDDPEAVEHPREMAVAGYRLLLCDTRRDGRDDGRFDVERLGALLDDRPTIVAMHHPPLLMGIPAWDAIGLPDADRAAVGEIVAGHPQVRRIVSGHVHRAALGSVGGCPVFTCPSTWIQGLLDFGHPDVLALVPEPPAFAMHVVVAGELTSHVQPVGTGKTLDESDAEGMT